MSLSFLLSWCFYSVSSEGNEIKIKQIFVRFQMEPCSLLSPALGECGGENTGEEVSFVLLLSEAICCHGLIPHALPPTVRSDLPVSTHAEQHTLCLQEPHVHIMKCRLCDCHPISVRLLCLKQKDHQKDRKKEINNFSVEPLYLEPSVVQTLRLEANNLD